MGRGNKIAADQAAVDAMRLVLNTIEMDGVIVIGEGEKDEAPMLFNGERLGTGEAPAVDIAVDPVEGTSLTAAGQLGHVQRGGAGGARQHVRARQPGLHGQDRGRP